MSAQSDGKIEDLESIRGIAALLVVLLHMPVWNTHLHDIRFIQNGYWVKDSARWRAIATGITLRAIAAVAVLQLILMVKPVYFLLVSRLR